MATAGPFDGGDQAVTSASSTRAVCSIASSRDVATVVHPDVADTTMLELPIVVAPREETAGALEAVRIGFLSDMPFGGSLGGLDPIILAFEDAIGEGRIGRPVELLASHVVGLPVGKAENVIAAYLDLVERGCVLVLSVGVTNNALVLRDVINETKIPYITMAGTTQFTGDYCFSLANGGHGEEAAILAAYLADQGYLKVVVMGEGTVGDAEYHRFFVEQAALYGIEILDATYFAQPPTDDELDAMLVHARDALAPDALVYCGFGLNSAQINPALARIGWDPPKIMNSAIMWAFSGPTWMAALEGWVGIEQSIGDHEEGEKNPNWPAMLDRYERRFGSRSDSTMIALLYDQGRAAIEALANAPELTGDGVVEGLERVKMMPSTLGGPRTYIGYGPGDHRGYRGDFMFMKQIRDGQFQFVSYHWPQWPINRAAPPP